MLHYRSHAISPVNMLMYISIFEKGLIVGDVITLQLTVPHTENRIISRVR